MRRIVYLSIAASSIIILAASAVVLCDQPPNKRGESLRGYDVRYLLEGHASYYAITLSQVMSCAKSDSNWTMIASLPLSSKRIRAAASAGKVIFVGTDRGLYSLDIKNGAWLKVFSSLIPARNEVLSVSIDAYSGSICIGTGAGLFLSSDGGKRWKDISGTLMWKRVGFIAQSAPYIYVCADGGIYRSAMDKPRIWERLLIKMSEDGDGDEGDDIQPSLDDPGREARCLAVTKESLYVGIDRKLFISSDYGKNWRIIGSFAGYINTILSDSDGRLFCATTKGLYAQEDAKLSWIEKTPGHDVRALLFSKIDKALWGATEDGIVSIALGRAAEIVPDESAEYLKKVEEANRWEPPFSELRDAAIRYADVSPDKIRAWHRDSRLRALAPKVSIGFNRANSTNTQIYTSATKDYVVQGPEDTTRSCAFSLSWEIGNIIWSDDQTNIDVRSRLMVQMRTDLLDDLRRTYFERKRIQLDLLRDAGRDVKGRIEKELRMQELTQTVDDMTGNYLSDMVRKRYGVTEMITAPAE